MTELLGSDREPKSLNESVEIWAERCPQRSAYTFLAEDGREQETFTYGELLRRVVTVAAHLSDRGLDNRPVLLVHRPGLEFVVGFLGCLRAGAIAVPAYPPGNARQVPRLAALARDADPELVLTSSGGLDGLRRLVASSPELANLAWLATDDLPEAGDPRARGPVVDPASTAFLQYTSGSTADPKGVAVTHANLLHNEDSIRLAFGQDAHSVVVGWLPVYHDMGLIGNVLQPLYVGARCVLMAPMAFLRRPRRWLEAVTRYRATTSGGPDFAYDLCVRRVPADGLEGLDLSSWRVAFNGSEPVRAETIERFSRHFASCGFDRDAFFPCYGLAEATLFVTGGPVSRGPGIETFDAAVMERGRAVRGRPETGRERRLVSCGVPPRGCSVLIVDPERRTRCEPGAVGEIWVSGPHVADGYRERPEESRNTFAARLAEVSDGSPVSQGPFLRTGDLGFVYGKELFVTGRRKELIILRGRNLYPQDIEASGEGAHPALVPGGGAAFSIEEGGEERLVLLWEMRRPDSEVAPAAAEALARRVSEEQQVRVHAVALLRPATLPRTTSGKVRRRACRTGYLDSSLPEVWRSPGRSSSPPGDAGGVRDRADAGLRDEILALDRPARRPVLEFWLRREVAQAVGRPVHDLENDVALTGMGLDSLGAAELARSIEEGLGVRLSPAALLGGRGVRGLADHLLELVGEAGEKTLEAPVAVRRELDVVPLSHGQRSLWFVQRLAPESAAYHIPVAAWVRPRLDREALERALHDLVARHAALRTVFETPEAGQEPVQRVLQEPPVAVEEVDAGAWDEETLRDRLARSAARPFDLARGPLLRVSLFRCSEGRDALLVVIHHAVADFVSMRIVAEELAELYRLAREGAAPALPSLPVSYGDFALWQRERIAGAEGDHLWEHWRDRLEGAPLELELPTDRPRPPVQRQVGGTCTRVLEAPLARAIEGLGRRHGATLFMTLLGVFQALLSRLSGRDDLLVGCPSAGRSAPGLEALVGYFVNPVLVRAELAADPTVDAWIPRVRATCLDAFEHQDYPFVLLAERLRPVRDPGRPALFQVLFVLQEVGPGADPALAAFALGAEGARVCLGPWELESIGLEDRTAQLDLALTAARIEGGRIGLALRFDSDLFDRTTASRWLRHLGVLLEGAVTRPGARISELPLLGETERAQTLIEWNDTARWREPAGETLHELFLQQARRTPDRVAVSAGGRQLTYAALDRGSARLAARVRELGLGPEPRIGLCAERCPELAVGLLGILRAGGAYLPLDPDQPASRLERMMGPPDGDSPTGAVVTRRRDRARLPVNGRIVVELDGVVGAEARGRAGPGEGEPVDPGSLAYVIYTSGSTGEPKGVMVSHRAVVNRIAWSLESGGLRAGDRVLQKTPLTFDVSIWELFWPLAAGAHLVLAEPGGHRESRYLRRVMVRERVTLLHFVPSLLQSFLETGEEIPGSVRKVITSGEALSLELSRRALAHPGLDLVNLYGPTEAAVEVTAWRCRGGDGGSSVPIGRPIPGTSVHVADRRLWIAPPGVPGELLLGGRQLARGYHGSPALTAERFVPDPFGGASGARLYRSGDLAAFRRDGAVTFLGRIDHQVKIRGLRIEPAEIEGVVARNPAVSRAVVVPRDDLPGGTGLVAYVTADRDRAPAESALRTWVRSELPEPMVPARFVVLDTLPLTASGKLDRSRLPRPEVRRRPGPSSPAALTESEEVLAGLFAQVLGVDAVGPEEDFFALGGHSLLATRLLARVRELFGADLPVVEVFRAPTVRALAGKIDEARRGAPPPEIVAVPRNRPLPLSFEQRRLWLLDRMEPGNPFYNVQAMVRARGRLELPSLRDALQAVWWRHEVLRSSFRPGDGGPVQVVHPAASLHLPLVDLTAVAASPVAARGFQSLVEGELRRPFELVRGNLARPLVVRWGELRHDLLVTSHHIVTDGWSTGVLVRDLAAAYEASLRRTAEPLAPLPVQYGDFAVWQGRWLQGELLERQLDYWRRTLAGAPSSIDLPTDRARPPVPRYEAHHVTRWWPPERVRALERLGRSAGATLFMTLLTALDVLLYRQTGQTDLPIGTPVANRPRTELEPLIGFFANTLVMRTELAPTESFTVLLERVRDTALAAYAHQDLPFDRLVEELRPDRDPSRQPLFQVLFAVQNYDLGVERAGDLELTPVRLETGMAHFDLSLFIHPDPPGLAVSIRCRKDLFDRTTALRMLRHLQVIVEAVGHDPSCELARIPVFTRPEQHQLLVEWQDTDALPPVPGGGIHALFESRVRTQPEAPALIHEGGVVTYRGLDRGAENLAARLGEALAVRPRSRVAVCLERSPRHLEVILAVLKLGAAYVPLDPEGGAERLGFVLQDSGASCLVTEGRWLPALVIPESCRVGLLEELDERTVAADVDPERPEVLDQDAAYVIYTSGSTGQPKGVAITHGNLRHYVDAVSRPMELGADDVYLHTASFAFSSSARQQFVPLAHGAAVTVAATAEIADPTALFRAVRRSRVSVVDLVPSYLRTCLEVLAKLGDEAAKELGRSVRLVLSASEPLSPDLPRSWRRLLGPFARMVNMFGQTETSGIVASRPLEPGARADRGVLPLGRALRRTSLRVLDPALRPVSVGVRGEIAIGGAGLGRGYLGRPGLTAERFVPNPCAAAPGSRLYRTGDLGRHRTDGEVEFAGRLDHQVKIRGFRVEPGEIESVLVRNPAVQEAVVLANGREGSDRRLVAYVVPAAGWDLDPSGLRAFLEPRLPSYMVPGHFCVVNALPRTTTGKLDRRSLPEPEVESTGSGEPRTPVEEVLASVWEDVLNVARPGVDTNFFELGGHSLLATQLASRVETAFGVALPLREIFEAPTISRLAERISRAAAPGPELRSAITAEGSGRDAPLSYAQERLWFLDQLITDTAAYNLSYFAWLRGPLGLSALARALEAVTHRHETLRTRFPHGDGAPVQRVVPEAPLPLPVVDLTALPDERRTPEVERLARGEARRSFELETGPLLRASLVRRSISEHLLLLSMHHIVSDAWSRGVLVREVAALYRGLRRRVRPVLPELPVQYRDFARWQRRVLGGPVLEELLDHWRESLRAGPSSLELPTDRPRPALQSFEGGTFSFELLEEDVAALDRVARTTGSTLFMVLLGAFQALLHRYTTQPVVRVGSPVANRNRPEIEALIGFFVNPLVFQVDLSGDPRVEELLERVREVALGAYAHQDLPFEKLVEELPPERELDHQPLFQAVLALQNTPMPPLELEGLEVEPWPIHNGTAKFDLTLFFTREGERLQGLLEFGRSLFDPTTIQRFVRHLRQVLAAFGHDLERRISDLPLLDRAERWQVSAEWNDTEWDRPSDCSLWSLFVEQEEVRPEAVALVERTKVLTYGELGRRSRRLAAGLRALDGGPGGLVGAVLEKGSEQAVATLGVLGAGAAYVPVAPDLPDERRLRLMARCRLTTVVTTPELARSLAWPEGVRRLELPYDRDAPEPAVGVGPASLDLAYVIFTSGSTGVPKGVMIDHAAAVNTLVDVNDRFGVGDPDRVLGLSPLNFDLSVYDLFGLLGSGGAVVLPASGELREPARWVELLERGRVTVWNSVPAFVEMLVDHLELRGESLPPSLRLVMMSGDWIPVSLPDRLRALGDGLEVISLGGATEAAIWSIAHQIAAVSREWTSIPYGRPLRGQRFYVLDGRLRPVPVGVRGELFIGGAGVALGYWADDAETAARFVHHPETGERLYRTGDLGRYRTDGSIEFLGRDDFQVKIRGHRIELGEIEATMLQHPAVRSAVVTVQGRRAEPRLVGYFVVEDRQPDSEDLGDFLRRKLPGYMVPADFLALDALPLTANGKVDRSALPDSLETASSGAPEALPPRTPTERTIAEAWKRALGLEVVGVDQNFFQLGGQSLLATRVMGDLRRQFGKELPLRILFEAPTVEELARIVDDTATAGGVASPIAPVERSGPLPLSFGQERLWVLHQLEPKSAAYNVNTGARLRGPLDLLALVTALRDLVRRHESLRTRFAGGDGRGVQVVLPEIESPFPFVDLAGVPEERREEELRTLGRREARRPFDLAIPPLFRTLLVRLAVREHALVVVMHHVVSDAWSLGVFLRDLLSVYEARRTGTAPALPPLPIQYPDFAAWQRGELRGERLDVLLGYWLDRLDAIPERSTFPADRPRPPIQTDRGRDVDVALPKDAVEGLQATANAEGATLFMALLAVFQVLLARQSGQDDVVVGSPVANRNLPESEKLIGFLVNTVVHRADLSGNPPFREFLGRVRDAALGAYAHQDLPFEQLVEALRPERDLSQSPVFQVMFALQNLTDRLPELATLECEPLALRNGTAKFDVLLVLQETAGGATGLLEYNADLFDAWRIRHLGRQLLALTEAAATAPESRVHDLPLLTRAERHQLRCEWNDSGAPPEAVGLWTLLRRQVEARPEAGAATCGDRWLSYAGLDRRVEGFAAGLASGGVEGQTVVAVLADRDLDFLVAMLGILRLGAVYLPLDPRHPGGRIRRVLEESRPRAVLVADRYRALMSESLEGWRKGATPAVLELGSGAFGEGAAASPVPEPEFPDGVAYVIFTSGSTGAPKGAMVPHRGMVNHLHAKVRDLGLDPSSTVAQTASQSFDISVWQFLAPLVSGGRVEVFPSEVSYDPGFLLEGLERGRITVFETVPSLLGIVLKRLAEGPAPPDALAGLAWLIPTGEALSPSLARDWLARRPHVPLLNAYGPTECSDDVSHQVLRTPPTRGSSSVPIGRPVVGIHLYVVGRRPGLVPLGVPGELWVGGVGVGRGYLGQPGRTAEVFVPDPFSGSLGGRAYRTGDLARLLPGGEIEFLGRLDHQVKIRGFRVELGEVEALLARHAAVDSAVVTCTGSAEEERRLVAYVVPDLGVPPAKGADPDGGSVESRGAVFDEVHRDGEVSPRDEGIDFRARRNSHTQEPLSGAPSGRLVPELRTYLREHLPDYQVPSAFVVLERLPLTPNGKVDRRALPDPGAAAGQRRSRYVEPVTPTEREIAAIWSDLLGVRRPGADDDFFELGGHSLVGTQVIARIRSRFGVELPLQAVFLHPTIRRLGEAVEEQLVVTSEAERVEELVELFEGLGEDEIDRLNLIEGGSDTGLESGMGEE